CSQDARLAVGVLMGVLQRGEHELRRTAVPFGSRRRHAAPSSLGVLPAVASPPIDGHRRAADPAFLRDSGCPVPLRARGRPRLSLPWPAVRCGPSRIPYFDGVAPVRDVYDWRTGVRAWGERAPVHHGAAGPRGPPDSTETTGSSIMMTFRRRLLLAVDAKGYGRADVVTQRQLQGAIQRILTDAAGASGLERERWETQVGGDSVLAVLPEGASEPHLVDTFMRHLDAGLREFNHGR